MRARASWLSPLEQNNNRYNGQSSRRRSIRTPNAQHTLRNGGRDHWTNASFCLQTLCSADGMRGSPSLTPLGGCLQVVTQEFFGNATSVHALSLLAL